MGSKLVQLKDGVLVEVAIPGDDVIQVAGGNAEKVEASFAEIKPALLAVCQPLADTWRPCSAVFPRMVCCGVNSPLEWQYRTFQSASPCGHWDQAG